MTEKPKNYDHTAAKREAAYKKRLKKSGKRRFERWVTDPEYWELDSLLKQLRKE